MCCSTPSAPRLNIPAPVPLACKARNRPLNSTNMAHFSHQMDNCIPSIGKCSHKMFFCHPMGLLGPNQHSEYCLPPPEQRLNYYLQICGSILKHWYIPHGTHSNWLFTQNTIWMKLISFGESKKTNSKSPYQIISSCVKQNWENLLILLEVVTCLNPLNNVHTIDIYFLSVVWVM